MLNAQLNQSNSKNGGAAPQVLFDSSARTSYLISVIVPCYNVEAYVIRALRSVVEQVDESVQLVVIDDGATDDTRAVVLEYINLARLRSTIFLAQANKGLSGARNTGLQYAAGEYIAFLDSDDYWLPGVWEHIKPLLTKGEFDLLEFDAVRVPVDNPRECALKDGRRLRLSSQKPTRFHGDDAIALGRVFAINYWLVWARIYHRNLIGSAQFEEGRNYEDMMFTPYRYLDARKIYSDPMALVGYAINAQSITQNINLQGLQDIVYSCSKMWHRAIALGERGDPRSRLLVRAIGTELFTTLLRERDAGERVSDTAEVCQLRKAARRGIGLSGMIRGSVRQRVGYLALWCPRMVGAVCYVVQRLLRRVRFRK